MKIERTFLKSRVAKRIFTLFIISALLPVLILAVLSYREIDSLYNEQVSNHLKQNAKSYGLSLYDRLLVIEEKLRFYAAEFDRDSETLPADFSAKDPLTGIHLWLPNQPPQPLVGPKLPIPVYTSEQLEYMQAGHTVLSSTDGLGSDKRLFLSILVNPASDPNRVIAASINPEYLWGLQETFKQDTDICVLTPEIRQLFCTDTRLGWALEGAYKEHPADMPDRILHYRNREEIIIGSWSLFLKARYFVPNLNIVVLQSRETALLPAYQFTGVYITTVLLTIAIITLISVYLIRKNLVPLEALMEGIRRLSRKDFNSNVNVASGDEFEEVAEAFNDMTRHIGRQFSVLSTLAEIDRLILSRPAPEQLINITLSSISTLVPCHGTCLGVLTGKDRSRMDLYLQPKAKETAGVTAVASLPISVQDATLLKHRELWIGTEDEGILGQISALLLQPDRTHCLALPIVYAEELYAVLFLHFPERFRSLDDIPLARDFRDRIAVAFSNAAWEEKLVYQAHHDILTDLPNRFLLEDRVHQEISRAARNKTQLALYFLDLDRFKNINDSLGHSVGDQVLQQIGSRLRHCVRGEDTVARLGGDEFILLITDLDNGGGALPTATAIAEKILREVAIPCAIENREIRISASIGIACYPADGKDMETLLRNADSAMYHAKENGSHSFQFYSQELNSQAIRRLDMESRLHRALAENQFELHFQPRVDLKSGMISGCESLIRWICPDVGKIGPCEFIPLSEEIGLDIPIGEWVLAEATTIAASWQYQTESPLLVSANISANHFQSSGFIESVHSALARSKLSASLLELEITESVAMQNIDYTILVLQQLREMGVRISIDDFGTGYSSLQYLAKFPVTALKIDKAFIQALPDSVSDSAIVNATTALAHSLGLRVTAEGVETAEQLQSVKEMGCDEIQGYLYSPPVSEGELTRILRATRHPDNHLPGSDSSSA